MKSIKLFLLGMFLLANQLFGQKYFFKQEYAPKSEYEMETDMASENNMEVAEPNKKVEKIKMLQEMKMKISMTTDKKKENKVPFVMKYTNFEMKTDVNGQEMYSKENPLKSMETIGVIEDGNKFSVTDIRGDNINESIKEVIRNQNIQMAQFAVNFPKDGMKIGDTFVQNMPYSVNIPQTADIELDNYIEYKLKKVENNKAYFDTKMEMKMKGQGQEKEGFNIFVEGKGVGLAEFDMNIGQFISMYLGLEVITRMDIGDVGKMKGKSDIALSIHTKKLK